MTEMGNLRNSVVNSNCEKKSTFRRLTDLLGVVDLPSPTALGVKSLPLQLSAKTACGFEFAPPFIGGQKERASNALANYYYCGACAINAFPAKE